MASTPTRTVERAFFVRASPSNVYRAISTPKGLVSWMVVRADLPREVGARYELEFDGGWVHQGTVRRIQPGRSITLTWAWEGVPVKGTTLTLAVRPRRGGAMFSFLHRGFPREPKWTDLYAGAERGWTYYGMNLKSVLETGHDLRSRWDG